MLDTAWVKLPDCPFARATVSVPVVAASGVLGDTWALNAEKPGNMPRLPATSPKIPTAPIRATGIGQCRLNNVIKTSFKKKLILLI
jgi:hypothetical protein